jgi:low affinity Fe/Cu permease
MRAALPVTNLGTSQTNPASFFARFANTTARWSGKPATFLLATAIVVIWGVTGPVFHYSDTWQLVINTGTTIITFLMVFLIQNTQNRDTMALQIKLDELILALDKARNEIVAIEEQPESVLTSVKEAEIEKATKRAVTRAE